MLRGNETDEELMILYQKGAEEAFKLLYERHSSKVFGYVKSKIRNSERANDIFQEVFVKIHKSKHLYNKSLPFLPWLFTVAKNTLVDDFRKTEKEKSKVQYDDIFQDLPALEVVADDSIIEPYLKSLPTKQQTAVYLRYIEEKTFEEISVILKTSDVNARQLVSRGVQRMKELFQNGDKL